MTILGFVSFLTLPQGHLITLWQFLTVVAFTSCICTGLSGLIPKTIAVFWYVTWIVCCKGGGVCVDLSPCFIISVELCVIHLCQPLYQPGPVSMYIKVIDEQFIRLMCSVGADKHPATRNAFTMQPEFAAARRRVRQHFSKTLQPLWKICFCEDNYLNVKIHYYCYYSHK